MSVVTAAISAAGIADGLDSSQRSVTVSTESPSACIAGKNQEAVADSTVASSLTPTEMPAPAACALASASVAAATAVSVRRQRVSVPGDIGLDDPGRESEA